jgi:REP element-mobilizing transposase RayT
MGLRNRSLIIEPSAFFVTASTIDHREVFLEKAALIAQETLLEVFRTKQVRLVAYVIMPEHYHLVVDLGEPTVLHKWLADIQRHTANRLSRWLRETAHPAHLLVYECHADKGAKLAVWKEQARAVGITSRSVLSVKIEYVHANPVRRGLVENPADWPWSSWRNYNLGDDSVLCIDRVEML